MIGPDLHRVTWFPFDEGGQGSAAGELTIYVQRRGAIGFNRPGESCPFLD